MCWLGCLLRQGELGRFAQILPPGRRAAIATGCPGERMYCAFLRDFNSDDIDPIQEFFADFGVGVLHCVGVLHVVCCLETVSQVKSLIQLSFARLSFKPRSETIQGLLISVIQHKLDCVAALREAESVCIR